MTSEELRLTQLFLEYHGFVRSCALRSAPMPGLVEDIIQQTFLEFIAKVDQWDMSNGVKPLLAKITRIVALQHWRQYTRTLPESVRKIAEQMRKISESEETTDLYQDEISALQQCIEKLSEKGEQMIRQYYFDRQTTANIARQFNMKPTAVNRALSRLREKLGECIQATLKKEKHT